ncbi:DEAD/DEAH box helicase, partial [Treponema sp. OttesenSCG-928-L16]|nr:DEAD/DEAH box helicase [Treponema sp. OttesenSCG-928-L16]
FLVLDEGDRLVMDELLEESGELVSLCPGRRQSVSCSATMSAKSRERLLPLLGEGAGFVESTGETVLTEHIIHWAFFAEGRKKHGMLRSFLAAERPKKALVFIDRGSQIGRLAADLQYHKTAAAALYGGMEKKARKQAIDDFRSGRVSVLVTSDLSARGLDIPDITHIIALDVPSGADAYIHRSGRTARAGRRGTMVSIGDELEMKRLASLEKKLGITVYPKVLYQGRVCAPEAVYQRYEPPRDQ